MSKTLAKELLLHAALLLLLLIAVFPRTMLFGEMVHPGGLIANTAPWSHHVPAGLRIPPNEVTIEYLTCFHAFYTAAKQSLQAGEWPLWNPYEFGGMPLLANYQSTVFYPPRLLHELFDVAVASTILMVFKFWLCGMTAYCYGRGIGMGLWPSRFLSVAWMLSSYNLIWCYWPLPDVSAWLPVLMLGIERLLGGRVRSGFAAVFVAATLLLLAGHPESAFVAGLGAGIYLLCRLAIEKRRGRNLFLPMLLALGAWAPALLMLATLLIPFGEYLANSHEFNQRRLGIGDTHAFSPSSLIALLVPRYYGTEADDNRWGEMIHTFQGMMYTGLIVWFGLSLLFSRQHDKRQNARIIALLVPTILLVALSLKLDFLEPLHKLPLMNSMWQCYFIAFPMFALPVLASIGFDRFLSSHRKLRDLLPPVAGCFVGALAIATYLTIDGGLLRALKVTGYVHHQISVAAIVALIGIVLLVLFCLVRRPTFIWIALTLLLAADLVYATRDLRASTPRSALLYETPLINYLQELDPPARVDVVSGGILPGLMVPYGVEEHWGHDGIYPDRIVTFYGRLGEKLWERMEPACAITHYLRRLDDPNPGFSFEDATRFRLASTLDGIEVYENLRTFPRTYLVGNIEVIPEVDNMFDRMTSDDFDPARTALVESRIPFDNGDTAAIEGSARVLHRTFTRVRIEAKANRPAVLVLADAYYPGWEASVDGMLTEIFPVNHAFRGIVIPAGNHSIEFSYFPASFRWGLWISAVTMIGASCCAVIILMRRKPLKVDG